MCHIRRHIWICHSRNNPPVEGFSTRGEIQVSRSVFVCLSVLVCLHTHSHTPGLEWKKSSAALFFFSLLPFFFSPSPHYDSRACSARFPWSQRSCGLCFFFLHLGAAIYPVREAYNQLTGEFFSGVRWLYEGDELFWWGVPSRGRAPPADKTDIRQVDPGGVQL